MLMHVLHINRRGMFTQTSASEAMFYSCQASPLPSLRRARSTRCGVPGADARPSARAARRLLQCCNVARRRAHVTVPRWQKIECGTDVSHTNSKMLSIHEARGRGLPKNSVVPTNHWQAKFITPPRRGQRRRQGDWHPKTGLSHPGLHTHTSNTNLVIGMDFFQQQSIIGLLKNPNIALFLALPYSNILEYTWMDKYFEFHGCNCCAPDVSSFIVSSIFIVCAPGAASHNN